MAEYKFQATVKDGKIALHRKQYFNKYVASLEGQAVEVIVQKKKTARSKQQNAYFHVIVKYFSEETGHDFVAMKEILKKRFLTRESTAKSGKTFEYVIPTSSLKINEMNEFIDRCLVLGAEYGIIIPDINELNLYRQGTT